MKETHQGGGCQGLFYGIDWRWWRYEGHAPCGLDFYAEERDVILDPRWVPSQGDTRPLYRFHAMYPAHRNIVFCLF
jgi:hypothetical protein